MTPADRTRLHVVLAHLTAHASQLDYPVNDIRGPKDAATFALDWPHAQAALAAGKHLMFDCSGAITCAYKWADLHDPNGLAYSHEGYTGTMLAHLSHYADPKGAKVGAIVIFGPGTGEHGAVVYETDPAHGDPLLFSHGERGAAGPIRLSVERQYHRAPVTMLNVSGL